MKKIMLLMMVLVTSLSMFAQNGGQSNENPVIKIDFVSYSNNQTTVKITNKQAITVSVEVKADKQTVTKVLAANTSDNVSFIGLEGPIFKIKAKALNAEAGVYGQVELTFNIQDVPVKFGLIKLTRKSQ